MGAKTDASPAPCTERDLGSPVKGDAATAAMTALLTSLGVDPTGFAFEVQDQDPAFTYVTAYQLVDGQRTGLAWSGTWTGAGVESFYGSPATLVDLGSYPVISPDEAVARLSDPRFGSTGGPIPFASDAVGAEGALPTPDAVASAEPSTPTVPPAVAPGETLSWPVSQVTITGAQLGLAAVLAGRRRRRARPDVPADRQRRVDLDGDRGGGQRTRLRLLTGSSIGDSGRCGVWCAAPATCLRQSCPHASPPRSA